MPEDFSESKVLKQIEEENTRNKLVNLLFEPGIEDYILGLAAEKKDPKLFLIYFHLVFLRSATKRNKLEAFYGEAEKVLKEDKLVAEWYLSQINEAFFYEFLFYGDYDARYLVTGLILAAFDGADPSDSAIHVLEQIVYYIGKKNMNPMGKILAFALKKNKTYEKYLKELNLADIAFQAVRGAKEIKSAKQAELKPYRTHNDLGAPSCVYTERPSLDQIDLLQAIEALKVNITF